MRVLGSVLFLDGSEMEGNAVELRSLGPELRPEDRLVVWSTERQPPAPVSSG